MVKKLLAIILFFAVFIGGFVYLRFYSSAKAATVPSVSQVADDDEPKILESKPTFQKKIAFVYVGELNNGVLSGLPVGNIATRKVTFNEKTKSIYCYEQGFIPKKDDGIYILEDTNSLDVLLKEDVYKGNKDVSFSFGGIKDPGIPNVKINNEQRLFLNMPIKVTVLNDQGDVQIEINKEQKILKEGQSYPLYKEDKGLKSKIVITNYGMWDTQNMTYVVK